MPLAIKINPKDNVVVALHPVSYTHLHFQSRFPAALCAAFELHNITFRR